MKRVLVALLVLAVLGAAGYWAYANYFGPASQPQEEREEVTVQRGSLLSVVNATGSILPKDQTTLTFSGAGRVAEVLVEEGQQVSTGQVLASLETTDLEYAITQAELALALAQAQLLRLQRTPADYEIAAAEAALDSVRASRDRLLAGPSEAEIRVARANLDQAQAALDQAQAAYNQVAHLPNVGLLPQALQLEQATIAFETAQASFELSMREPSGAELAAAESAIAQAEAALARLQQGIADEDLLIAQIQVQQAQLSLDQAQHQLEGTELTAPHPGTITLVSIKPGDLVGGQPAFILTDLSDFRIDILVDEIDIARIDAGQPVTVTLDALPGETLAGQVERIAEIAAIESGVVTYRVQVRLDPVDVPLRSGMTATVDIVTERRSGILLVPNRFVTIDRTTGKTFVDRDAGGQIQPVEIQIGLRDEIYSEVLAGLEEGDRIVLIKLTSREQLRRAFEAGAP